MTHHEYSYYRYICIALLLSLFSIPVLADESIDVTGAVFDDMHSQLVGATVNVLQAPDSTAIASVVAKNTLNSNGEIIANSKFYLSLPHRDQKYIIAVDYPGYDTEYVNVDPSQLAKNEYEINIGKIYLQPKTRKLSEVNVVATKIKFYNKGDTIVYNADAFNLPEGSMLDALVRQLPNVRLTQEGEIFVNGQKVESLLLNGKDFIGSDNKILLNNLGAYTVKNLKVYEKRSFASEIAQRDLEVKKPLVMDVRLKKEFMYNAFGNIEGGYGTHDRFMGRFFLGAMTKQQQLMIFGNANNVNSSTTPQKDSQWRPENMPTGTHDYYDVGMKQSWDSNNKKWTVFHSDYFRHVYERDGSEVTRTNFLSGGNTFEKSYSRSKNKTNKVQIEPHVSFKGVGKYGAQLSMIGSYENWNRTSEDIAATLSSEPVAISSDMIRNVYSGELDSLRKTIINRNIQLNRQHGHFLYGKAGLTHIINLPDGIGTIMAMMDYQYRNRKEDRFQRFDINYGYDATPAETADRYYKLRPQLFSNAEARVNFNHSIGKGSSIQITYWYKHRYDRTSSDLYRLELLDEAERLPFGELPSAKEYRRTIDVSNSYINRTSLDQHIVTPRIDKKFGKFYAWCEAQISFNRQGIDYERGSIHENFKRNSIGSYNSYMGFSFNRNSNSRGQISASINTQLPDLVYMVNMTDSLNPLNITIGNKELKNATNLNINASWYNNFGNNRSIYGSLSYNEIFNALAQGYTYDSKTGVRTSGMYNVAGNRTFAVAIEYNTPLASWLSLRNALNADRIFSVDLIGEDSPTLRHNKVRQWDIKENINLNANFSGQTLYVRFNGNYRRYSANLANFIAQNTWTLMTGVGGIFRLPFGLEMSTDFSVYDRRGYTDENLNTDNFVWNARLAYSILKGDMTFMIDGYDMLRNIDNVSYAINAQGRTETIRTVLPSFFMAHVQWKFNKKPNKNRK